MFLTRLQKHYLCNADMLLLHVFMCKYISEQDLMILFRKREMMLLEITFDALSLCLIT